MIVTLRRKDRRNPIRTRPPNGLQAVTMASGPHMEPEKKVHEAFVNLLKQQHRRTRYRPGGRRFRRLCRRTYQRVMNSAQSDLDGLSGSEWLRRKTVGLTDGGIVTTRVELRGRPFAVALVRTGATAGGR